MIRPIGTQAMETSRLVLRRFALDDGAAMYHNWASDPEVCRYLTWQPHANEEVTKGLVERWVKEYEDPYCFRWGIVMKQSDTLIGSIDVVRLDKDTGEGEIGYCISKDYWRKGITSEALHAVLVYLFIQAGFDSVVARHDSRNPASGAVMRKNGLTHIDRRHDKDKDGEDCLCDYYRITKAEFEAI